MDAVEKAQKGRIVLPLQRASSYQPLVILQRKRRPETDWTGAGRCRTGLERVDQSGEEPHLTRRLPSLEVAPHTLIVAHVQVRDSVIGENGSPRWVEQFPLDIPRRPSSKSKHVRLFAVVAFVKVGGNPRGGRTVHLAS